MKIEILDKINGTYDIIERREGMLFIHPLTKESIFLEDFEIEGKRITGIIFKEDQTILILYK